MQRLLVLLFFSIPFITFAQKDTLPQADLDKVFEGGSRNYKTIIRKNTYHPKELRDEGVNGRVYFQVTVDTAGKMKVDIVRTPDDRLNAIVIKAVEKTAGMWKPMIVNGRKEEYTYIDYIFFEIR